MSQFSGNINIVNSNTVVFTNTLCNDMVIYTSNNTQRIVIGTSNTGTIVINSNNAWFTGSLGVNGVPASYNILNLNGTNSSTAGPHLAAYTSADSFPVFQQLNFAHNNIALNFDMYYDGLWKQSTTGLGYRIYKTASVLNFDSTSGAGAGTTSTTSNIMCLSNTNVGIGSSAPVRNLCIRGATVGTFTTSIAFHNPNQDVPYVGLGYDSTNDGMGFFTNTGAADFTNEPMFIKRLSGNVGIGTISPGYNLEVIGNMRASTDLYVSSRATFTGAPLSGTAAVSMRDYNAGFIQFYYGASILVGSITTNGSSTTYNTTSDYRLKTNITPMQDGLDTICKLQPKYFEFKSQPGKVVGGLIAHEAGDVVPQAVTGDKDAVDKDGKPQWQMLDYKEFVTHLISAVQELKTANDAIMARLTALEEQKNQNAT
jgi:hypothetical protein